jgi:predicted GNAT superfamily acetyltransferase
VSIELRDVTPADFPALVAMNRAAMPAVSEASLEDMAWFAGVSVYFKVAAEADALHGFLIALTPDVQGYPSDNFRWFQAHYDDFVYVDRIVVAGAARGRGLGQRFYEDLERFARGRATRITCEVNTRPRNDGSLRFHARLGFHEVGTQDTEGGKKTVSLLSKPVGA